MTGPRLATSTCLTWQDTEINITYSKRYNLRLHLWPQHQQITQSVRACIKQTRSNTLHFESCQTSYGTYDICCEL